jgi:hypothetical protein
MRTRHVVALAAAALVVTGPAALASAPTSSSVGAVSGPGAALACPTGATYVQAADSGSPSYVTQAGVVTSWSTQADSLGVAVELKAVHSSGASSWLVHGSSTLQTLTPGSVNTFKARVPVAAGDRLALYVPYGSGAAACYQASSPTEAVESTDFDQLEPLNGTTFSTTGSISSLRLNLSAVVEVDNDGDGYGDVTQDACPTMADRHDDCPAPVTSLTAPRKVKTSHRRAKVTVSFGSSKPGSTFTCSVDGAAPIACTSPRRLTLTVGTHHLYVTATDSHGNTDPSAATATVVVKHKHKHPHPSQ